MNEIFAIILCLLATVGIVQCAWWLRSFRRRPSSFWRGYHVIPLYNDPARLEERIRYALSQLSWGRGGCQVVVLADMGLEGECIAICERFLRQNPGLLLCDADSLPVVLRDLDRLLAKQQEPVPGKIRS